MNVVQLTARYELALCYEEGSGTPKNIVEAYKWFNLAAAQGLDAAAKARDRVGKLMSLDQVADAQRRSVEFRPVTELNQSIRDHSSAQ